MAHSTPKLRQTGPSKSSFSETDDRRVELILKTVELALSKPKFVTTETAAIVLGSLWIEAADRSGIPPVAIYRKGEEAVDEYGLPTYEDCGYPDDVYDPAVLRALAKHNLTKLLKEAHELGAAGKWRRVWTVLRDAFGLHGIGR